MSGRNEGRDLQLRRSPHPSCAAASSLLDKSADLSLVPLIIL